MRTTAAESAQVLGPAANAGQYRQAAKAVCPACFELASGSVNQHSPHLTCVQHSQQLSQSVTLPNDLKRELLASPTLLRAVTTNELCGSRNPHQIDSKACAKVDLDQRARSLSLTSSEHYGGPFCADELGASLRVSPDAPSHTYSPLDSGLSWPSPSSASSPISPSERARSPTLSSPADHFSPWTHHETLRSNILEPTPVRHHDFTQLPVERQGRGCLYPGSIFEGSQRSRDISYDVTITILNVDFQSSTLCGYLRIVNLTEDYPELTTYFDAEIIGPRFGFIAPREWGSSETEDLAHWSRFSPFRSLKQSNVLKRPNFIIRGRHRNGTTFLRLKERFLVPDHKLKEIAGASFAGFYYVAISETVEEGMPSLTGYYYHPKTDPYQQLTLRHVPQKMTCGSFEFA